MTTLALDRLPGRCAHGFHVASQGCADCGVAFKFAGQARAAAAHPNEGARVETAVRQLAATGKPFSANQARALHGQKGGVVGATFTSLRKEGVIRPVGDETSGGASAHGHRIYRWVGVS